MVTLSQTITYWLHDHISHWKNVEGFERIMLYSMYNTC